MKIARLNLRAFGHFDNESLDFDAGQHGMHVVYGANEAGKSTTLRALRCLFYGIRPRTDDAFRHAYGKLRIGAVLVRSDGARLECVRRKANTNDLRDGADDAPLEAGALANFLGGIDETFFERMFAIDHHSLQAGGRELIQFGGELSSALVAAAGLTGLRSARAELDKELDGLFSPRESKNSTKTINKKLLEFREAHGSVGKLQLSIAQWKNRESELEQVKQRLAQVEAELMEARAEKSRLERVRDAIPEANRLHNATAELAAIGPVVVLADDFARRRQEQSKEFAAASSTMKAVAAAIADLDEKISELNVPEGILSQAEAIEELQSDLGEYRTAQKHLPNVVAQRDHLRAEAGRALGRLRPDLSLDDVESLRLTANQKMSIQRLGNQHQALVQRLNDSKTKVNALAAQMGGHAASRGLPKAPRDEAPLKGALRRSQGVLRLENELIQATAKLRRLEEDTAAELARLTLFEGPLSRLEAVPIPSAETIDCFEKRLADAERALADATEAISAAADQEAECLRGLQEVRLVGEVPSEDDLRGSRDRRDRGWRLVQNHWRGQSAPADEASFAAEFGSSGDLFRAYENAVKAADDLADRLRHQAERVAKKASLESQLQLRRREREKHARTQSDATSQRAVCLAEWRGAWQPSGIDPLSPREMRAWQRDRQSLLDRAENIRNLQAHIASLAEQIDACRRELDQTFLNLGEPARLPNETLAAQLDRGDAMVARIQLEAQIEEERSKGDEAKRELEAWTMQWSSAVAPLALGSNATPADVNRRLADVDDLLTKLSEADALDHRIAEMERFSCDFTERLTAIVTALDGSVNLNQGPVESIAKRVVDEHQKAAKDNAWLTELRDQRAGHADRLAELRKNAAQAEAVLNQLCQEAGCERVDDLPERERASAEARRWKDTIAHCHDALAGHSGSMSRDEFVHHLAEFDPDALPDQIERLAARVAELDHLRMELSIDAAQKSNALMNMEGSAAAAEAEQLARNLAAELAAGVEEYSKLRLASVILDRVVARYRETHQGPVLRRASDLFAKLTAGSFAGLRTDEDDKGRPVLLGIRASDGQIVSVNPGMSEGTADQLYLALRLATIEAWLEGKESFPFVVDDILIKFDNERSAATLRVLAELSRRTQVIFFTHHEHLVELARQHVDAAVLFVHELNARLPTDILAAGPRLAR